MGLLDAIKRMFSANASSPTLAWLTGATAIVTGNDEDPGGWPASDAQEVLREYWSLTDRSAVLARLEQLCGGSDAWDGVRGIHVARMAAAAGYVASDESLRYAVQAARALQARYGSFHELALAYWERRRAWAAENDQPMESAEVLEATRGRLHVEVWSGVDFKAVLDADGS